MHFFRENKTIMTLIFKTFFITATAFALASSSHTISNPLAAKSSEIGCVRTSTGTDYTGSQNVSTSGRPCVRWDSLVGAFREHIKQLFLTMPERSAAKAHNYCRNPNSDQRGLWCFVSQLGTVQFCTVPKCATFGSTSTSTTSTTATPSLTSRRVRTSGRHLVTSATTQRVSSSILRNNEVETADSSWTDADDSSFSKVSPNDDRGYDMQNDSPPSAPYPGSLYGDENDPYQQDNAGSFAEEKEKNNDDWSDDTDSPVKPGNSMIINFRDSAMNLVPSVVLYVCLLVVSALLL